MSATQQLLTPQRAGELVVENQEFLDAAFRNIGAGEYIYTGSLYYPKSLQQMSVSPDGAYVCIGTVNGAVNEKGNLSRKHDAIVKVHFIYLDDIGTKYPIPALQPSAIIESSPDNFQYLYFLTEPITREEADQLLERMKLLTDLGRQIGDPGAMTIGRLGRVGLGINGKTDRETNKPIAGKFGHQVGFTSKSYDVTYTAAELAQAFQLPALDTKTHAAILTRLSDGVDVPADQIESGSLPAALEMLDIKTLKIEDGIIHIECPEAGSHSMDGGDKETSIIVKDDGVGFNCLHGHEDLPNYNGTMTGKLRTAVELVDTQDEGEALIEEAKMVEPGDRDARRKIIDAVAALGDPSLTGDVKKIFADNDVMERRDFNGAITKSRETQAALLPVTPPESVEGVALTYVDNFKAQTLAAVFLRSCAAANNVLVNYQGQLYSYQGGGYKVVEPTWLKHSLTMAIPTYAIPTERGTDYADTTRGLVGDVEGNVMANLYDGRWKTELPFWRYNDGSEAYTVPPERLMVFANGLLDIKTGMLYPSSPALMVTSILPFAYDPEAPAPERFKLFLKELWPNDEESPKVLQEMFGYLLSGQTKRQKIFTLIGVKRSGKGTIGRLLTLILGAENVASTPLTAIGGDFGRQGLIDKMLWLLADSRKGDKVDQGAVVETLLSISGEDHIEVARKYLSAWKGRIKATIVLMANMMPKLFDVAGAMQARIIPIKFNECFEGREDFELEGKLEKEVSGIIRWALEGLTRLNAMGDFTQSPDRAAMLDHFESLATPLHNFIGEEIVIDEKGEALKSDVFMRWQLFAGENQISMQLDMRKLTNLLHEAAPSIISGRFRRTKEHFKAISESGVRGGNNGLGQGHSSPGQRHSSPGQTPGSLPRERIFAGLRLTTSTEKEAFIDATEERLMNVSPRS